MKKNKTKTQHNTCWTPLCTNKQSNTCWTPLYTNTQIM